MKMHVAVYSPMHLRTSQPSDYKQTTVCNTTVTTSTTTITTLLPPLTPKRQLTLNLTLWQSAIRLGLGLADWRR